MFALTQGKWFVCGGIVVIPLTSIPGKKQAEGKDCDDSPASRCTASKELRQDLASLNTFLCPAHYLIKLKKPFQSCLQNPACLPGHYFSNQKINMLIHCIDQEE